jgi:CheY-like chemotaxis protein
MIINMRENNSTYKEEITLVEKYKDKSILVVEDEYISSQLIFRILNKYLKVDCVATADECFSRILENDYNLIFMDINLGYGLSGIDIVKRIRSIEKYRDTPIVATTAFAMSGDKEEFINAGCTDHLSKPFTKEKMLNQLKEIKL